MALTPPVDPPSQVGVLPPVRFPRRFGDRYVLLKQLGEGGMGEVFMGVSGRAGVERVCALKIVRDFQPDRDAEDLTQRFLDEAKVVTRLSHDNLVYVFDFGIVDRKGYLGMEYVPGKTLTDVWNRCAANKVGFPTGVALFLIGELASALGYAHQLGGLSLVHRDISPSNLMLAYTGGVKLIDFGLAKWKSKVAETATGINWGKVNYMSPEQHQGKPLDNRSDLYSAGVILWELLTGRQLFPNAKARLEAREIPPPSRVNPAVSPSLDAVVLRAVASAPAERFQSGEELAAAISAEMPRHAGKRQLIEFMERLFGADRLAEEEEQTSLLLRAAEIGEQMPVGLSSNSGESAGDPLVGTVLADRYFVRRWIGQGAMGRVYEGHHTGVGKRVAIKIPRNAERRKTTFLQRFRREAQAASQIGHPNIADVTDCGTTPAGDFFFVMEFVDGVDLDKVVRREGTLPLERVLVIALQIARAMEAAHQAGIIHRDLKPSNVMLVRAREEADLVKVLDFGVAKFLRGDTTSGHVDASAPELTQNDAAVGTPRYMAPEQIGAGQEVDFRADIYAVGGVLYYMLSGGRAPVEGDSVQSVWHRKLNEEPTPLRSHRPDLPSELESLVMRCLERDPAKRPSAMSDLKAALVLALEKTRAAESGLLPQRRVRSETAVVATNHGFRRSLTVVAALGCAAIAGAATWRWRSQAEPQAISGEQTTTESLATSAAAKLSAFAGVPAIAATPPLMVNAPPLARSGELLPAPSLPPAPSLTAERPAVTGAARRSTRKVASLESAAAAKPELTKLLGEGEALFQNGRFVQALTAAEKAARTGGGASAFALVGKIQLEMEDFSAAVEAYQKALALDPGNADARKGLARAHSQLAQAR